MIEAQIVGVGGDSLILLEMYFTYAFHSITLLQCRKCFAILVSQLPWLLPNSCASPLPWTKYMYIQLQHSWGHDWVVRSLIWTLITELLHNKFLISHDSWTFVFVIQFHCNNNSCVFPCVYSAKQHIYIYVERREDALWWWSLSYFWQFNIWLQSEEKVVKSCIICCFGKLASGTKYVQQSNLRFVDLSLRFC
jgi:hypothetical protein